ncbi:MAG TPA: hypothetical protein VD994_07310 [Prosthecobacter sp.]|nr:hypothetical protein [Prosthecobacter sp.]
MPKCPACVAAYLALATGLTIPIAAATHLRTALIILCLATLLLLTTKKVVRSLRERESLQYP